MSVARCRHVTAEEAGCRQIRPVHPRCAHPTRTATGSSNCCAPGMVVDANELSVRYTELAISRDAGDNTPETLCVRLVGRMKHGRIGTRWLTPRR
jgi:hypothetical protein